MGEPKPLASLTSGLLARKGGARPAMRRQPLGSGPAGVGANGYDDLGWNDMGYDVDPEQQDDAAPRMNIKSLLTGSMPAHNVEAEHAVDAASNEPAEVTSLPWAELPSVDVPVAKPEIVRQQEVLQARVEQVEHSAAAFVPVYVAPAPAPVVVAPVPVVAAPVPMVEAPAPVVAAPVAKSIRRPSPPRAAAADAKARDKAAFTLRLDAERHLRLRLASAIYNRSAQQILIDVLDDYLAALPEIDAMASRLPTSPAHRVPTHTQIGDDQ